MGTGTSGTITTAAEFIDAVKNNATAPVGKRGPLVHENEWNSFNPEGRAGLLNTVVDDDEVPELLKLNNMSGFGRR